MDENHGVRVKRSRVADLGQVVREIAPSIKPKPSIKGYITLGIREVYVYRNLVLLTVITHNPLYY
jgi:hypothetical protein